MSEAEELRAEIKRLWDAIAPVLPPQHNAQVATTMSHPAAGVPKGQIGFVHEVKGRVRVAIFAPRTLLEFDVSDPRCGVEWDR